MCSKREGDEMLRVFTKYYRGRPVDEEDREQLDRMYYASLMDYEIRDGRLYAKASETGRMFKPTWRTRLGLRTS